MEIKTLKRSSENKERLKDAYFLPSQNTLQTLRTTIISLTPNIQLTYLISALLYVVSPVTPGGPGCPLNPGGPVWPGTPVRPIRPDGPRKPRGPDAPVAPCGPALPGPPPGP